MSSMISFRKLYWTDSNSKDISVSDIDGKYVKTLIAGVTERPRGIIVYPKKGWVYC